MKPRSYLSPIIDYWESMFSCIRLSGRSIKEVRSIKHKLENEFDIAVRY